MPAPAGPQPGFKAVTVAPTVLEQVEHALATDGSRPNLLLRHVTDLFLVGAAAFTPDEIEAFDDTFLLLVAVVETASRALLSMRLAPCPSAPPRIVQQLAKDDAIEVAAPIISQSLIVTEQTLIEVATGKGQEHLLAITIRSAISEVVSAIIVKRGDPEVLVSAARNLGASFPHQAMEQMLESATRHADLAVHLARRPDLSQAHVLTMVHRASHQVRERLMREFPATQDAVDQVVAAVACRVSDAAKEASADLPSSMLQHARAGRLDDDHVASLAAAKDPKAVIAAIAVKSGLSIHRVEQAMSDRETLVVIGKAIGLSSLSMKSLLRISSGSSDLAHLMESFERLKPATAVQILTFYQNQEKPARRQIH
jgi:uncharacterized protein (DUF2336 family)